MPGMREEHVPLGQGGLGVGDGDGEGPGEGEGEQFMFAGSTSRPSATGARPAVPRSGMSFAANWYART